MCREKFLGRVITVVIRANFNATFAYLLLIAHMNAGFKIGKDIWKNVIKYKLKKIKIHIKLTLQILIKNKQKMRDKKFQLLKLTKEVILLQNYKR